MFAIWTWKGRYCTVELKLLARRKLSPFLLSALIGKNFIQQNVCPVLTLHLYHIGENFLQYKKEPAPIIYLDLMKFCPVKFLAIWQLCTLYMA